MAATVFQLHRLAKSLGVLTSYQDIQGRKQQAGDETLMRVVQALGAEVSSLADVPAAIEQHQRQHWATVLEPVQLAWAGKARIQVRLAGEARRQPVVLSLKYDDGSGRILACEESSLYLVDAKILDGVTHCAFRLPPIDRIPLGYHQVTLKCGEKSYSSLLISAPKKTYAPARKQRNWGIFAPLYALHSEKSWGGGSLAELESLWKWTAELGGGLVATLPLLAGMLDEPFDPSPYAPISRMFWNEFYLDLHRIPELKSCEAARDLLNGAPVVAEIAALRDLPLVDYRRQMALKRQVLEVLTDHLFAQGGQRRAELGAYLSQHREVHDYAEFRAVQERQRKPWPDWPQRMRDGEIQRQDYDESAARYHCFVQWLAHQQLRALAAQFRTRGPGLYLDLPLGVHRDGYDPWREKELFVRPMAGGAPPDTFFTKGQNWGFAPLHPQQLRRQGYSHQIACLRHHLQMAGVLRMDHVMGLHRLYWIPQGMDAVDGVYVEYPAAELHAILCLESHLSQSLIAGENLGTVPPTVNSALRRHGIRPTYVAQYELNPENEPVLRPPPRDCVASLNTHDMPPFAAYWQGTDLTDLRSLDLIDNVTCAVESERRVHIRQAVSRELFGALSPADPDTADLEIAWQVVDKLLAMLMASPAETVLINLEDLWLETAPQNTPGTWLERPNWRRKVKLTLEELAANPDLRERLLKITAARS